VPVTRVLNGLDVYAVEEITRALPQHFAVLLRNAAEGIDVNRRGPSIGERMARLEGMRDVTDKSLD